MVIYTRLFLLICTSLAQETITPTDDKEKTCKLQSGEDGVCREHTLCPEAFKDFPAVLPVNCGFNGMNPIVCCPVVANRVAETPVTPLTEFDISPPKVDFHCGITTPGCPDCVSGGGPARTDIVRYSVLVGERLEDGTFRWFCGGVLINRQWVLTGAPCSRDVNVVRVGERDYNDYDDNASPITQDLLEVVVHPDYKAPASYHDLALLKLRFPLILNSLINPVCLPWGDASKKNLINETVTLSGWGATEFGGRLSSVLLEVNLTVYDSSLCNETYSSLITSFQSWPRGIGQETLCIGDIIEGNDSCSGDSGGPVTYLDSSNRYVLAGTVSSGYGCGLKEYPGLYVNISSPVYLDWIKRVAFQ